MNEFVRCLTKGDVEEACLALLPFVEKILIALVIYFVGRILVKWVLRLLKKVCETHLEASVTSFLMSLASIALNILLVLVVIDRVGISTTSFIAVLTSAGLAVGLALQGSLSNLAGGLLILITKPFRVGDYIAVSGLEGTVTEIGVCYTKLITTDNRVVVLPNGSLANSNLVNVSQEPTRRIDLVIPMSYDDDIRSVKAMLSRIAEGKKGILQDKPIEVFVQEFGATSVNIGFRFWVQKELYWDMMFEVQEEVRYAMKENGFAVPCPKTKILSNTEAR